MNLLDTHPEQNKRQVHSADMISEGPGCIKTHTDTVFHCCFVSVSISDGRNIILELNFHFSFWICFG